MPKPKKPKTTHQAPDLSGFVLLDRLFEGSEPAFAFPLLLQALQMRSPASPVLHQRLWRHVAETQEFIRHPRVGDALQDFLLERFLDDPNLVHRKAETQPIGQMGPDLILQYKKDLERFQTILREDWTARVQALDPQADLPSFEGLRGLPVPQPLPEWEEARRQVKEKILHSAVETPGLVRNLCAYFLQYGQGIFARHRAFRWAPPKGRENGRLEPVASPDPIRLADLKGYDGARQDFLDNLEVFSSGKPGNHTLIYGERGTGKSSTVKAGLNEYQDRGLRLVEVSPLDALEVPSVLRLLRGRRERFMIFLDDLSFDADDERYRGLKGLLEGTVESVPDNVILVATSNRRHLMPESFSDRADHGGQDEVHPLDAVEEKLSLSDRFGLVVSFYAPDQETYLAIVRHLAEKVGLKIPRAELERGALRWSIQNNGRSGRTA